MLIYVLLLLFIVMLTFTYFLFKKDIIEPAIIFTAAYVVSIFCCAINVKKWGINLDIRTFILLIAGAIEFIAISYGAHRYFEKNNSIKKENETETFEVSKKISFAIIIYNIIVLVILITNVFKIAGMFGQYKGFSEALTIYKEHTSYIKDTELPDYLTILMKPIIASAYIYIFFWIKNIVCSKKNKLRVAIKYWYYLIPTITYIIQRISESNRGSIINFVLTAFTMFIIVWNIKNNWGEKVKIKSLIKLACVGVIGLVLFYYSAAIVGRVNSKGMIDYITCYCGGSIECLNLYIKEKKFETEIPGEQTFGRTIRDLNKIGIISLEKINDTDTKEFRYYNNNMIGNVYTSYRRWIQDFGFIGVLILQAILALIFNVGYNLIKYWNKSDRIRHYMIILYTYFMYTIYMHPIDSLFYLETFTIATAGFLIFLTIIYWILTLDLRKKRLSKGDNSFNKEKKKNVINILYITPALNNCGGIESYCMNYYRNMSENIHIDFATHNIIDDLYKSEIESKGGKVYLFSPLNIKHIIKSILQIKHFFEEHNDEYDIIHCNMANAAIFYFYYAKKHGVQLRILHSHQNNYADKISHKLRNIPLIYLGNKYATVRIACSKIAGDFLFKRQEYIIVNNAINLEKYKYNKIIRKELREKLKIKDNEILLGTVGRLTEQKNQKYLLNILKLLNEEKYKLIIIGDGHLEAKLKQEANQLKIQNNVIFTGSVSNVEDYLQAMDIFLLPSQYEGLGIVNIEAQVSGLPTIVSNNIPQEANITELIKFISLNNINNWCQEIVNTDRKDRHSYIEEARRCGYDINNECKKLEEIYINLVKNCKGENANN